MGPNQGPALPHLRAWRLSRLMTQEELGKAAGMSGTTISNIERGQHVRLSTMRRLAKALGLESGLTLLQEPPKVAA